MDDKLGDDEEWDDEWISEDLDKYTDHISQVWHEHCKAEGPDQVIQSGSGFSKCFCSPVSILKKTGFKNSWTLINMWTPKHDVRVKRGILQLFML